MNPEKSIGSLQGWGKTIDFSECDKVEIRSAEKVSGGSDTNWQSDGVLVILRAEASEVDGVPEANE